MDTRISSPREQGAPIFHRDTEHGQKTDKTDNVLPAIILKQKHKMERVNLDNIVACVPFQLPPIVSFSSHMNNQGEPLFPEELENNSFKVSGHTLRQKKYLKSKVPKRVSPQNNVSPSTFNYKHPNHSYVTSSKVILQSKSSAEKVQQWINENIALPSQNRVDIGHKRKTNQRRVLPNVLQESTNSATLLLKHTGSGNSSVPPDFPEKSRTEKTNVTNISSQNDNTTHRDQLSKRTAEIYNSSQTGDKTNATQTVHITTGSESVQNSSTTSRSQKSDSKEQTTSNNEAIQDTESKEKDRTQNESPVSLQHIQIKCNVDKLKLRSGISEIMKKDTLKITSNPEDTSTTSKSEVKNKCSNNKTSKDLNTIHHAQNKKDSKVNNVLGQNKKNVSSENEGCEKCSDNTRKENSKKIINTNKIARNHNPTVLSSDNSSLDSDDDDSILSSSSSSSFSETSDENRNKTKRRSKNKNSCKRIPLKVNKKSVPVNRSGKRRKCKRVRWAARLVKIRYFQKDEPSSSGDSSSDNDSD